ncbi:HTD2 family dehydratase [Pseudonocardia phyllosphaerae]|uniref:FAS1-like dehydratase domain-containing protein n=1 Tax=Pseudonocardia phyllosphaerae TaxID=3390502 RepID=UPI00397D75DD
MTALSALSAALRDWDPAPLTGDDVVSGAVVAAVSAMFDLDPVAADGDPLPPLWHWFAFLDVPPMSALGEDGHPAHGRFLPPVPDRRRMIAGGRLEWRAPWRVGERVTRTTALHDVRVRTGRSGEMAFVTTRSEFAAGGRTLAVEEQDVVYRSQPAGSARGIAAPQPEPRPAHEWELTLPTSSPLLFRMSALTANAHRIHYDQPYATGVEGYPGLVVHGPLLALLGLEIPRRHLPGTRVGRYEYRLVAPAFAGPDVWAGGTASGASVEVEAGSDGGPVSLRGRVGLSG